MELLAPAGDFEKLKIALKYGADAVYFAANKFGLRSGAKNFSTPQIAEAVTMCHNSKVKAYIVLNAFLLPSDLKELPDFLTSIFNIPLDGVICSDLATISMVKKLTDFDIHVSTQASSLNHQEALFYKEIGAKRLILARETTIIAAGKIKQKTNLEVEIFAHGAMCSALSGHCVISNYQNGRDSNRGGCIQNCRHEYLTNIKNGLSDDFLLGAKDLNGIFLLQQMLDNKIDSIKIEGRMKSHLYLASVIKIYRFCIDQLKKGAALDLKFWNQELNKISNRGYHSGFLVSPPNYENMAPHIKNPHHTYGGILLGNEKKNNEAFFLVANLIKPGDYLEFLLPGDKIHKLRLDKIVDINNNQLTEVKSGRIIRIQSDKLKKSAYTVARIA